MTKNYANHIFTTLITTPSFLLSLFICSNSSTTCNFTEHNEQDNKAKNNSLTATYTVSAI